MNKKLVRSNKNRMIAGVLGGVAEFFNVDVTIVRLVFVIALIFTAFLPVLIAYLAAVFIIPNEGDLRE